MSPTGMGNRSGNLPICVITQEENPPNIYENPPNIYVVNALMFTFGGWGTEPRVRPLQVEGSELGKGKYGVVRLGTRRKTQEPVAIKIMVKVNADGKDESIYANREIECMKRMSHPNIVEFQGTYESTRHIYIVMEVHGFKAPQIGPVATALNVWFWMLCNTPLARRDALPVQRLARYQRHWLAVCQSTCAVEGIYKGRMCRASTCKEHCDLGSWVLGVFKDPKQARTLGFLGCSRTPQTRLDRAQTV